MSKDLKQDWNKAKDTAAYYVNRAESKIEEAASTIKKEYEKSDLKEKVDNIKEVVEKKVEKVEPYWNKNKDNILVGSGITAGALMVLLSMKLWFCVFIIEFFGIIFGFFCRGILFGSDLMGEGRGLELLSACGENWLLRPALKEFLIICVSTSKNSIYVLKNFILECYYSF